MNKSLFFTAAAAAIALVSCSKDETVEVNNGRGIEFCAFTDNLTRASEVTLTNLESFDVHAFQGSDLASATKVWKDTYTSIDGGSTFSSGNVHFWPTDANLYFFAYNSAALSGGTANITATAPTITDVQPATTSSDQKDLVIAYDNGNETSSTGGAQPLNFKHAFSQIIVKAKNANAASLQVNVLGVRVNGLNNKATLTFPTNKKTSEDASSPLDPSVWYPANNTVMDGDYYSKPTTLSTTTPVTLTADPVSIMFAGDASSATEAFMLLPQTLTPWDNETSATTMNGAYISVLCQISVSDGNGGWTQAFPDAIANPANNGKYAWTAVPFGTELKPGYKYSVNLDFSNGGGTTDPEQPTEPTEPEVPVEPGEPVLGGKLSFSVTVSGWTDASEDIEL